VIRRLRDTPLSAYTALVGLAIVFMFPVFWAVSTSFKSPYEFGSAAWLPESPTWDNYVEAVTAFDFPHYLKNSFVLASIYAVLNVLSSSLAGYAFARLRAPGRDKLFLVVLSTLMIPWLVTFVPQFVLFSRLELVNTYWPWVLWGLSGSAFHIFLFRQFFINFPTELEEAAEMDGCGPVRVYWQIFLPNSLPVLATSAIFSFAWVWSDWINPALLLDDHKTTLAVKIATGYTDPQGNPLISATMAGSLIYALPLVAVFFLIQRYIIQGIVTSGLKG
jgi:ABC-type glycerol-3-phosphate transport system permease component